MCTTDNDQPPRIELNRMKHRLFAFSAAAVVFVVAAAILFLFDPVHSSFYPTCVFKKLTGWSCPACGCLRATHQLLHGHIAAAFHLNALYVVAIPLLALLGIEQLLRKRVVKKPPFLGWTLLVLFVVFGIVRNLPAFSVWSGQ